MLDSITRKYVRRRENTWGNARVVDAVNRNPGRFVSQLAVTSAAGLSANVRRILGMTSLASELALTRLREHRKEISDVLARYGASNPRLFGSIAQGNAGPESDVDLLLDLAPQDASRRRLRRPPQRRRFGICPKPGHRVVTRSAQDRLTDIQMAIARVYSYRPSLKGEHSEMAVSAILREIGIIGEAVNALPESVIATRPEIAWRQIAAMRNFLIHEYFNID